MRTSRTLLAVAAAIGLALTVVGANPAEAGHPPWDYPSARHDYHRHSYRYGYPDYRHPYPSYRPPSYHRRPPLPYPCPVPRHSYYGSPYGSFYGGGFPSPFSGPGFYHHAPGFSFRLSF